MDKDSFKEKENSMDKKLFALTFQGKDEDGLLIKSVEIMATSDEEAYTIGTELMNSRIIYSAIEVGEWKETEDSSLSKIVEHAEKVVGNLHSMIRCDYHRKDYPSNSYCPDCEKKDEAV